MPHDVELHEVSSLELTGPVDSTQGTHVDCPDQPDDDREQHRDPEELIGPDPRHESVGYVIDAVAQRHSRGYSGGRFEPGPL